MTRRRIADDAPELNLTPMIDVVFLLVIFFLVGARFSTQESRIDVDLPGVGRAAPLMRGADEQVVTVSRAGEIIFQDAAVDLGTLSQLMRRAVGNYPDLRVTVRGDRGANLQDAVGVLQTVRAAGVQHVAIATRSAEQY